MTDPTLRERRRVRRLSFLLIGMFAGMAFVPGLPSDADFEEPLPIPTTTAYNPYRALFPGNPTTTTTPEFTGGGIDDALADRHDTEGLGPYPPLPLGVTYEPVTTTTLVPPDALCGEWWVVALGVGWSYEDLPTLDRIMWNESRCQPDVVSATRDYGLVQINRAVWRSDVESWGWQMDDLLEPAANLAFGKYVADTAESIGWCRWEPWHGFSGDYC